MKAALGTLVRHSDLFRTLTAHRIRVRYKPSALGLCWAVLQPVALMLIFTLVFGRIARVPSEGIPYPLFAYSGLLIWSCLATGLSNAMHALVAHAQLITKVYFPQEILPLTYVAAALFDLGVGALVLGALLLYHGHPLTWNAVYALPVLMVLTVLVTASAFLRSAIQVQFRDVGIAVPLIRTLTESVDGSTVLDGSNGATAHIACGQRLAATSLLFRAPTSHTSPPSKLRAALWFGTHNTGCEARRRA
jgi:lipopolysaccharide transport system permease protein